MYLWFKSLHLLFVIAWMAAVFYLPRILVNVVEAGDQAAVRERLLLMAKRLYRFGHIMFGIAVLFGIALWQGWRVWPDAMPAIAAAGGWLHAKLALIAVLLAFFIVSGRMTKRAIVGHALPSSKTLRLLNELPVLVLLPVIWLAIAKPF